MAGKSNKQLHPYFRKLMKDYGWDNLTDMSKSTGIHLNTLREWAINGKHPTLSSAEKLSNVLGVAPEKLIISMLSYKAS